jgi:hypothetical protein
VRAGFALGSSAVFKQYDDGTMVMDDLAARDVHALRGARDPLELATGLHEALAASATPLSPASPPLPAAQPSGP